MSKFPEKLFCNLVPGGDGEVYPYLDLETAGTGVPPVRVGIYTLTEVVEARTVVETIKVEN